MVVLGVVMNKISCPICKNEQGLVILVDFVQRIPIEGYCVKKRIKPSLKRKYGQSDSGCGASFSLTLKNKLQKSA